jgi:5-methylcytosine-specific restriction endonuclease McrA
MPAGHERTIRIGDELLTYREYLRSPHWAAKRAESVHKADRKCQMCGWRNERQPGTAKGFHVHHNTYERVGHELPTDLTVLCEECHKRFHGKGKKSRKPMKLFKPKPKIAFVDPNPVPAAGWKPRPPHPAR